MLRIAGQRAGPIGLNFLWTLMGGQGCYKLRKFDIFPKFVFSFFFHGQQGTLHLVFYKDIHVASCKNAKIRQII